MPMMARTASAATTIFRLRRDFTERVSSFEFRVSRRKDVSRFLFLVSCQTTFPPSRSAKGWATREQQVLRCAQDDRLYCWLFVHRRRGWCRDDRPRHLHAAVFPSVAEVDEHADDQPYRQAQPGIARQADH